VATIGQFDPDTISINDPQADFLAVVTPAPSETVPNLIRRQVIFNKDKDHVFYGEVIDHQGNEVTIEYSIPTSDPVEYDGKYKVTIVAPSGPKDNISSPGVITVDNTTPP
jgi:hypothetical protein